MEKKEGDEEMVMIKESPQVDLIKFESYYEKSTQGVELTGRKLRNYRAGTSEVYGEILPCLVEELRVNLGITSKDVFYDVGSGIGNVVIQLASQVGCRCIGVEIRSDLHDIAQRLLVKMKKMLEKDGMKMGQVDLICDNVMYMKYDYLPESTIVYLNNVLYPEDMQQCLLNKFECSLQHGSRIIAMRDLFPRMRLNWRYHQSVASLFKWPPKCYQTQRNVVSWMDRPITYRIYHVDREQYSRLASFSFSQKFNLGYGDNGSSNEYHMVHEDFPIYPSFNDHYQSDNDDVDMDNHHINDSNNTIDRSHSRSPINQHYRKKKDIPTKSIHPYPFISQSISIHNTSKFYDSNPFIHIPNEPNHNFQKQTQIHSFNNHHHLLHIDRLFFFHNHKYLSNPNNHHSLHHLQNYHHPSYLNYKTNQLVLLYTKQEAEIKHLQERIDHLINSQNITKQIIEQTSILKK